MYIQPSHPSLFWLVGVQGEGMMDSSQKQQMRSLKIAVVGDVHDQWEAADEIALQHLGVDLLLFVGDFGNEAVEVVRAIAQINLPMAAILGNHDAWYSATDWGMKKCPYNRATEDRVQQQLDLLGVAHVGYEKLDFPALNVSIVGGRPFSWGGSKWLNTEFYRQRYQVSNFAESATRIVTAVGNTVHKTVIFIGHSGPYGLGDRPEDPCGKDWHPIGGDHGDPDLAAAIAQTKQLGKQVPLVAFGHMHHHLRHTRQIQRTAIRVLDGTVYLNAACVPRIKDTEKGRWRNFSFISLEEGVVTQARLVWVDQDCHVVSEQIIYQHISPTPQLVS
jgi:uncharacterized protein (TIGR04168 family)